MIKRIISRALPLLTSALSNANCGSQYLDLCFLKKSCLLIVQRSITLAAIFLSTPFLFAQTPQPNNTMVLTTYYPAPFGAYKKMTISDNVGIGTTAPGAALHVSGSSPETRIQTTSSDGEAILNLLNDTNKYLQIVMEGSSRGTTLAGIIQDNTAWIESGGDNFLFTTSSAAPFIFAPNRVEALRITNGGNVGIGTVNPTALLELNKTALDNVGIQLSREGTPKAYILINTSTPNTLNIQGNGIPIAFSTNGFTDTHMKIDTSGNVGIGTMSPQAKLHVKAAQQDTLQGLFALEANNTAGQTKAFGININAGTPEVAFVTAGGGTLPRLSFSAGVPITPHLIILPNGNVGIGTTGPNAKFQVNSGDVYVQSIGNGVILRSPDGSCYRVTVANGGGLSSTFMTCP